MPIYFVLSIEGAPFQYAMRSTLKTYLVKGRPFIMRVDLSAGIPRRSLDVTRPNPNRTTDAADVRCVSPVRGVTRSVFPIVALKLQKFSGIAKKYFSPLLRRDLCVVYDIQSNVVVIRRQQCIEIASED